jgi:hypothetical protein
MASDEIQQYMERSFAIDCPRMVLRQNVESDARVYEGPGSIYQNNEGELFFKLYSTGGPDSKILERAVGPGSMRAGEVFDNPAEEKSKPQAPTVNGPYDCPCSEYLI